MSMVYLANTLQYKVVANTKLLARVGLEFNGELSSNIFEDTIDEDFSSLYPSIILAYNTDGNTLIGLIVCENDAEISNHFGELVSAGDIIQTGSRILKLPNVEDVLLHLDEILVDEAA